MLDALQPFENVDISSWLVDGMLKRPIVAMATVRGKTMAAIAALCMAGTINASTIVHPIVSTSTLATTVWQTDRQEELASRDALGDAFESRALHVSLSKVRAAAHQWVVRHGVVPNPRSVRLAGLLAHQMPVTVAPEIGVDGDGNVFLHFASGESEAYLTVEPNLLHLVTMAPGRANIYIDDERVTGKRLPDNIRTQLAAF